MAVRRPQARSDPVRAGCTGATFRASWAALAARSTRSQDSSCGTGATELVGEVADQAQLHGLLTRIRDLGLELESVIVDPPDTGPPPTT